jgi:hypothetical protein
MTGVIALFENMTIFALRNYQFNLKNAGYEEDLSAFQEKES